MHYSSRTGSVKPNASAFASKNFDNKKRFNNNNNNNKSSNSGNNVGSMYSDQTNYVACKGLTIFNNSKTINDETLI